MKEKIKKKLKKFFKESTETSLPSDYFVELRKKEIARIIENTYTSDGKIKPELTLKEIQDKQLKNKKEFYWKLAYIALVVGLIILLILAAYLIGEAAA
ncbi:hypothetical protein [Mycoplasmopsis cricetuli]|uniref:hypothetical protein n=1 Tax=Mycoplasmopsis cricetuli TaxID=171283 RepID=UPI00046F8465|nr:hypothetical protein [Mycoplasmopsis cricetuli]